MEKIVLHTPIKYEDIKDLRIGDIIYISGNIETSRDSCHKRRVIDNIKPEFDLNGGVIYHAGPIVKEDENGNYSVVSCGPTTSRRMESLESVFLKETGVKVLIGKGGMMDKTTKACKELGAIHCAFPGGCAIVAANCIKKVNGVEWLDLGMAEAFWKFEVEEFGPLIVSIDTLGNNLFEEKIEEYKNRRNEL